MISFREIVTSILILLGAGTMFVSVLGTRQILGLVEGSRYFRNWRMLYFLMIFFLAGYLAAIVFVLVGFIEVVVILTGAIFFFGALFVYLVVRTGRITIAELQVRQETQRTVDEEKDGLLAELQEREEAQRQLLATLHELGSPIIPLSEGVIAMPLIGTIDSERAQQVRSALLQGVADHRARVVIVDITGVPVVDTMVAGALLKAALGVRLLGAEPVLTGIRAEVAQTIVGLGLDLSGVVTRATLQEGLAYAIEATGGQIAIGKGRGMAEPTLTTGGS